AGGSGTVSTSTAVTTGYFPTWGTASALTGTSTIYQSGSSVGIGTISPSSTLHVVGTFQVSSTALYVSSTTGYVGIGTTVPSTTLHVVGTFQTSATSTFGGNMSITGNLTPGASSTYSLGSATLPWKDLYVASSTVYFGSLPLSVNGSNQLTFNGTVLATGGTVSTSSAVTAGYFPVWGTASALNGTSTIYQSGSNTSIGGFLEPTSVLHIVGAKPAGSAGNGTDATQVLQITGGQGGDTTGSTGQIAGAGAVVNLTGGKGGDAGVGATSGNGGSITLQGGAPGTAGGAAGIYGNVLIAATGGKVGIGMTSPSSTLHTISSATSTITSIYQATSTQTVDLTQWRSSSTAVLAVVNSTGWFGIGTAAPSSTLDVIGAAQLRGSSSTVGLYVSSAGFVGAGTTSPSSTLHVVGTFQTSATSTFGGNMNITGNLTVNNTVVDTSATGGTLIAGANCPGGTPTNANNAISGAATVVPTTNDIFYNSTNGLHSRITTVTICALGEVFLTLTDAIAGQATGDAWTTYTPVSNLGSATSGFFNNIYAINYLGLASTLAGGFDVAEQYPTNDTSIEAGDVVVMDSNEPLFIKKATTGYDNKLVGVISTNPALTFGNNKSDNWRKVALAGRVPVKISTENGAIEQGDYLTSSAIRPGYAMKMTSSGVAIGMALDSVSDDVDSAGSPQAEMVMMMVRTGWQNIDSFLNSAGLVGIGTTAPSTTLATDGTTNVGIGTSTPYTQSNLFSVATSTDIFTVGLDGSVVVGTPIGGAKGYGTLNAQAVYDDSTLLTDFVFDLYYDGAVLPEDVDLHGDYKMLTIDEMMEFNRENRHLPTITGRADWNKNGGLSLGKLASQLWQTVETNALYIGELNSRLKSLEQLTSDTGLLTLQGSFNGSSTLTINGQLIVKDLAVEQLTVNKELIVKGQLSVAGQVTLSADSVGRAEILPGDTAVNIVFAGTYPKAPVVTLSPVGSAALSNSFRFTVLNESSTGFMIAIHKAQDEAVRFNWHAFAPADDAKLFVSDGTKWDKDLVVITPEVITDSASTISGSPTSEGSPTSQNSPDSISGSPTSDSSLPTGQASAELTPAEAEAISGSPTSEGSPTSQSSSDSSDSSDSSLPTGQAAPEVGQASAELTPAEAEAISGSPTSASAETSESSSDSISGSPTSEGSPTSQSSSDSEPAPEPEPEPTPAPEPTPEPEPAPEPAPAE
ncbi:MAG: hypothetical protein Q7R62_01195, partial [bacterium]|nr:hypothetical protein [bacterium]